MVFFCFEAMRDSEIILNIRRKEEKSHNHRIIRKNVVSLRPISKITGAPDPEQTNE